MTTITLSSDTTGAPYSVRGQILADHALLLTPRQREMIAKLHERNKL